MPGPRFSLHSHGLGASSDQGFAFQATRAPAPGEYPIGVLDEESYRASYWYDRDSVRKIFEAHSGTLRISESTMRRVAGTFQINARLIYVCALAQSLAGQLTECKPAHEEADLEITGAFDAGPLGGDSPGLIPHDESAPVVTDSALYTLHSVTNGWRGTIRYVFTNTTQRAVSLLNCNGQYALRLEQRQGAAWVSAWSPAVQECLSPPIHIHAGASIEGEVEIFAGRAGSNTYPQFTVPEIEGIYRLVIESAYFDYDHAGPPWGEVLPLEQRTSSPFEIRTGN